MPSQRFLAAIRSRPRRCFQTRMTSLWGIRSDLLCTVGETSWKRFTAAAMNCQDGEVTGVDLVAKYVFDGLACIVEVEHGRAKIVGGDQLVTLALRVTSLFRLEHGIWKLVHRHADPITTPRPGASVIAKPDRIL
jgi:hypothetical protein